MWTHTQKNAAGKGLRQASLYLAAHSTVHERTRFVENYLLSGLCNTGLGFSDYVSAISRVRKGGLRHTFSKERG